MPNMNGNFWLHVIQVMILALVGWFAIEVIQLKDFRSQTNANRWTVYDQREYEVEMDARLDDIELRIPKEVPPPEVRVLLESLSHRLDVLELSR